MARVVDLLPKERLQPSLLDRLTDDEPEKQAESRERRVLSMHQLRISVLRDLAWLFNAGNLASAQDLEGYPLVTHSAVNYGIPDLAGRSVSGVSASALEDALRQAIVDFEPRILRETLQVRARLVPEAADRNALVFEVEGDLWGQPVTSRIYLRTEIDLDSGQVSVAESAGAPA